MIELPEACVLAEQIDKTLTGKTIVRAEANKSPHAFAMYTGDPASYSGMLSGKKIAGTAETDDGSVKIICGDMLLVVSTPIKYHAAGAKLQVKHQLLLEFDDSSQISCTVQMWGCMYCFPYDKNRGNGSPSPLTDAFDEAFFNSLISNVKQNISAKAFLATEQRIPGLGNGVLQDILFNAGIHPKRKLETLDAGGRKKIYDSVKSTLRQMRDEGGRDTERDLFGEKGGYRTILSNITLKHPCRVCGGGLIREAYLGGNIYYCPVCQPL